MSLHLGIIGAGPCGLYAAITAQQLGHRVTIFEAADRPGGLAAGRSHGGNHYDLGVHMLHAFDEEVFDTCAAAMGDERIEVPLKAHIHWAGKLYHYPLRGRDILAGFPPLRLARCLLGLLHAEVKNRLSPRRGDSAEDALIEMYGVPLYEVFFEEFTHKYWGRHPRELSAEFIRRKMPRLSAVDVFKNALQKMGLGRVNKDSVEGALRFETLHYSCQGCKTLPEALAAQILKDGGTIHYNAPVTDITLEDRQVVSMTSDTTGATTIDRCLSTAPLDRLIPALTPTPPTAIIEAASRLLYRPMVVFGLLVRKERCMEALYTYYRSRSFHRVGEPKNAGLQVTPEDHTVLIVEMTCEPGELETFSDTLPGAVLQDFEDLGLCTEAEIVDVNVQRAQYAYPIFALGFEKHYSQVTDYLDTIGNLISTGRQGAFTYPNMHTAMRQGADAATTLLT